MCDADDVDDEDVIRVDVKDQSLAIFKTSDGFFCTDGYCTHENQHLEDGFVDGNVIECPLHQGRFNIVTGKALSAPACVDLKTHKTENRDGKIFVFV